MATACCAAEENRKTVLPLCKHGRTTAALNAPAFLCDDARFRIMLFLSKMVKNYYIKRLL